MYFLIIIIFSRFAVPYLLVTGIPEGAMNRFGTFSFLFLPFSFGTYTNSSYMCTIRLNKLLRILYNSSTAERACEDKAYFKEYYLSTLTV